MKKIKLFSFERLSRKQVRYLRRYEQDFSEEHEIIIEKDTLDSSLSSDDSEGSISTSLIRIDLNARIVKADSTEDAIRLSPNLSRAMSSTISNDSLRDFSINLKNCRLWSQASERKIICCT